MYSIPQQLLQQLHITNSDDVRALGGNANKNYLVKGSRQSFVVKQLLECPASEAQLEGEYRKLLHAANLPVSEFHLLTPTSYVLQTNSGNFVATDYVEGTQASKDPETVRCIAHELARVHLVESRQFPAKSAWFSKSHLASSVPQIDDTFTQAKHDFQARAKQLPNLWASAVPTGVTHGDLHINNFVMSNHGTVSAILDWEDSGIGPLVLDVAHTLRSLAFNLGDCDEQLAQAFLNGYQALRPLVPIERELLVPAIRHSALLLSVWAHVKFSRGEMGQELFDNLKNRYTLSFSLPASIRAQLQV